MRDTWRGVYDMQPYDKKQPDAARCLAVGMPDYMRKVTTQFQAELGRPLTKVTTPYLSDADMVEVSEALGRFALIAAHYVATFARKTHARPEAC